MSTIVIKVGGGEGIDPTALAPEIAELVRTGERVVLVHGGSHETNQLAEALGHPTQTITSPSGHQSRRTDRRTLEIFEMVYCGRVNKSVVESLRRAGVDAVGLSGIDAGIWIGSRKDAIRAVEDGRTVIIRDDLSGRVESVDACFLNMLLDAGRVPVLTPPAITPDGIAINVDADRAAAATAGALHADELLLLSNVPGLLRDPADRASLIETIDQDSLDTARAVAKGRMKNKVLAAQEALGAGVTRVVIGSAAGERPIAAARRGAGTVFSLRTSGMIAPSKQLDPAERVVHDLVAVASVSGSERAAAQVFVRSARDLGLDAEIDEAGNALAHRGPRDAQIHIVLLGHIDTVHGYIPVRVEDGILHGRGSVDAKGPLAAMLVAAAQTELPPSVRLTVAGAVGEETPLSPGARRLVNQFRPDACIIGEPSGWDGFTLAYKGRLLATAVAERSNAHSAGPDASACDDLFAWWAQVQRTLTGFNAGRDRAFDQIQSSVRLTTSNDDGLTQRAELTAGFRLPPVVDPHDLASQLASLALPTVTLSFTGHETAVVSDRNDPVARALSAGIRAQGGRPRPKHKTGTSDFNIVAPQWRCPIAAYGPGDSSLDHTPLEHLDLAEYRRSIAVLSTAITTLANELLHADTDPAIVGAREERL